MAEKMLIGGHRGMGETDSDAAIKRNMGRVSWKGDKIPPENTRESLRLALGAGADFIETDAIASKDGEIFLIHSNDPLPHLYTDPDPSKQPPARYIGQMNAQEIKKLRLKLANNLTIPTLTEVLRDIQSSLKFFTHDDILINIELKGVQETKQERSLIPLAKGVIRAINEIRFPLHRILFSSFSIRELKDLVHDNELSISPEALNLAFLFYPPEFATKPLYYDREEEYRSFSLKNLTEVLTELPQLKTVIPEIKELISEKHLDALNFAKENKLNIMTYNSPETLRDEDKKNIKKAFEKCSDPRVKKFGVITDYIFEVKHIDS